MNDLINVSSTHIPMSVIIDTGTPGVSVTDLNAVTRIIINSPPPEVVTLSSYNNNFNNDPLGPLDILNSDYISPELQYILTRDNEALRGEITTRGLTTSGGGQLIFALSGFPTKKIQSTISLTMEQRSFSMSLTGTDDDNYFGNYTMQNGMGFELYIFSNKLYLSIKNTVSIFVDVILVSVYLDWFQKPIICESSLVDNDLTLIITVGGVEVYNDSVLLTEAAGNSFWMQAEYLNNIESLTIESLS